MGPIDPVALRRRARHRQGGIDADDVVAVVDATLAQWPALGRPRRRCLGLAQLRRGYMTVVVFAGGHLRPVRRRHPPKRA